MPLTVGIYLIFFATLVWVAVYDHRTRIIPNWVVFGLAALWFVWRMMLAGLGRTFDDMSLVAAFIERAPVSGLSFADSIIGSLVLGGGMLVLTVVFEAVTHRPAFGGGDIKLLAVIGLYMGVWGGIASLALACVVALPLAWFTERRANKGSLAASPELSSDVVSDEGSEAAELVEGQQRSEADTVSFMRTAFAFGPALCIGTIVTAIIWTVATYLV